MNILNYTLTELIERLESKELTSVKIVSSYIEASKKAKELNVYITELFDEALKQAKLSDQRRAEGKALSRIDGIPIGVKDIFLTKGIKTTNASKFLENFIPPYESTVTQNLLNAGAIFIGKLNMDEFAMGSGNLTSAFGCVINPWKAEDNENRVPGGSSGGSSAGVSARCFPVALGTDTGGSIRQPAAFCGLVGMKPTYGTCSRYGVISFASSLDQPGPITRNVKDNAIMLQHMASYDKKDASMVKHQIENYEAKIGKSIKGMKIGIPKEYFPEVLSDKLKEYKNNLISILKKLEAEVVDISLPHSEYSLAVYYMVAPAEASSNYSRFDGIRYGKRSQENTLEDIYFESRSKYWGSEVKRRILVGTYNTTVAHFDRYIQAAKVRRLIANDFIEAFKKVDVILTPTTTSPAFTINNVPTDPIEMYLNDIFTITANLVGVPAISIPVGLSDEKLPLGMQLIGNFYKESSLYQVAHLLEQEINFNELPSFVKNNNLY